MVTRFRANISRHRGLDADRHESAGAGRPGIPPRLVGRIAAVIYLVCGVLGLVGMLLPVQRGSDPIAIATLSSGAILLGLVLWVLPWDAWPRWYTHILVPIGFALISLGILFSGDYPYVFGAMFCLCFMAIGLAHRPGTSILILPIFAVAYGAPLLVKTHDVGLSLGFAAFVGVLCVVVSETVAWMTAMLGSSQRALLRAHRAVNDISADLTSVDPQGLAQKAATRLGRLLDVPNVLVYSLSEFDRLNCLASVIDGEIQQEPHVARKDLSAWPAGAEAVASRTPAARHGELSSLALPLIARDRVVGLAEVTDSRPERITSPERVADALSVCRLIALSIQDAEALADQETQNRRLASLLESSRAVASVDNLEDALALVTERAATSLATSECVAYEYMPDIDAVVPRAMWEANPTGWDRLGQVMLLSDHPVERRILERGKPLLENVSDPDLDETSKKAMLEWGEKSCFTVPMRSADGPMGLLVFWDQARERHFTSDERAFALGIADLAGDAVRRTSLVRRLQHLSGTDSLTGLANHRQIHELLMREQARAERYGLTFSLVMLDVDGFKLLNDTYGHPCGDTALQHIATLLSENARTSDIVGRYGGDEFVLVLPETRMDEAHAVVEKMRAAVADEPFSTPTGDSIPLHASFGIATYPDDGHSVNELVVSADAHLYMSKRRGGNIITTSSHLDSDGPEDQAGFGILESMVAAVDNKDQYTRRHSEQVTELALTLGTALGLPESSLRVIRAGSLLHDVGKIGIPDRILRKPGRLTNEEWAIVKGHPEMGEALVRTMPDLHEIQDLVIGHHEHFDGTGYPKGLKGADIPLLARILAVSDAYSAMITDRPYRKALTVDQAIRELRQGSGSHFDPGIVSTFIQCVTRRGSAEAARPAELPAQQAVG